jgi:hypothetical protein
MVNNSDDGLIPISRDQRLKKTIGKVTYLCRPPVGDLEAEIFDTCCDSDELNKLSKVERMKKQNHMIDLFLTGWEGENVPVFPKDGMPSQDLPLAIKNKLYGWYLDQVQITIDESKN